MTQVMSRLNQSELKIMVELMKLEYSDFENQEFNIIAKQISKEFGVECLEKDLEIFYSDEFIEDFELESRKIECNYYKNLEEYEDRIRFK
jgi:hypothetical protein